MRQKIEELQEKLFEKLFRLYNNYSEAEHKTPEITQFYRKSNLIASENPSLKQILSWAREVLACSEMIEGYPEENLEDLFNDLKKVEREINRFLENEKER